MRGLRTSASAICGEAPYTGCCASVSAVSGASCGARASACTSSSVILELRTSDDCTTPGAIAHEQLARVAIAVQRELDLLADGHDRDLAIERHHAARVVARLQRAGVVRTARPAAESTIRADTSPACGRHVAGVRADDRDEPGERVGRDLHARRLRRRHRQPRRRLGDELVAAQAQRQLAQRRQRAGVDGDVEPAARELRLERMLERRP